MQSEAKVEQDIVLAASEDGHRLLRNNVGAYKDKRGMWIKYGVGGKGGSDEIGWTTVIITPEMVGKKLAVFTAIEVKSETGRASADQKLFIGSVQRGGGIAGIARSAEDYREIISKALS
jgi:hypothetical protein